MSELLIQKALRSGMTFEALKEKYAISAKQHSRYHGLWLLKYNQIESPFADPLVRECRGLILDQTKDWEVVAFPYTKFFNHGEGHAAPIDWASARIYEKVDGSLITLYWYDGHWEVATSGTPDGATPVGDNPMTFSELFWQAFNRGDNAGGFEGLNKNLCYMFELCTPHNRVVIPHTDYRIVLHGVRDRITYQEQIPDDWAQLIGVECVMSFPIGSLEGVIAAADALNPMQQEGFVVVDAQFNRVKIKSPQYVALHHMKDSFSKRRMMEVVRTNEHTEFLAYFPEYQPLFDEVKETYSNLVEDIELKWAETQGIKDRKEFALQVKDLPYSSALFALYTGKTKHAKEFLAGAAESLYYRLMGE